MTLPAFGLVVAFTVWFAAPVSAAPPVRAMYTDALAREQAVRVALSVADAPLKIEEVRAVVAAYETVVKEYPASGYSDNALWQAGRLALDAFARFNQSQDKDTGVRLLQKLTVSYPTSRLARQVPAELARIGWSRSAAAAVRHDDPPSSVSRTSKSASAADAELRVQPGPLAIIRTIRRSVLPDAVRVTIELDAEVPFHDERIADPARVFLDLPGTRPAASLADQTLRFETDADIVRQVRVGRHPNNTTRVVLDAAGVTSYSVYPLYSPYRLVIDCVRGGANTTAVADSFSARAPAAMSSRQPGPALTPLIPRRSPLWLRRPPSGSPQHSVLIAAARASGVIETPAPAIADLAPIAPLPLPAVRNAVGGLSIARQLGLGVSRIVIDPGHGGHDPGAQGRGVNEAELVLDVALRLEKLLQKVPGIEVILTRRTNEFVVLEERPAIANREGADLFLSIHANASAHPQARGIETYFLNFANNQSAAAVAARENATSTQSMGALPDFVKAIALNNKVDESRDFATQVERAMAEKLRGSNRALRDLGVKQAPFVVLIGAVMPSVLAEISFVTNPQEAKLLKANAYRQRIAEALFDAIRKYQTSLKNVTTVAVQ